MSISILGIPFGWIRQLADGFMLTLQVGILSYAIAIAIGFVTVWARLSASRVASGIAFAYIALMRALPEVLTILLLYYGGLSGLEALLRTLGYEGPVVINAFTAGCIAIAAINGAYVAEALRAAIIAIPHGQIEAAKSIGMKPYKRFRRIMLPQLLRRAVPALGNIWISLLKETSLVSVIGLSDIVRIAGLASSATHKPFTYYVAVAMAFLAASSLSVFLLGKFEKRLNISERPA